MSGSGTRMMRAAILAGETAVHVPPQMAGGGAGPQMAPMTQMRGDGIGRRWRRWRRWRVSIIRLQPAAA